MILGIETDIIEIKRIVLTIEEKNATAFAVLEENENGNRNFADNEKH